MGPKSPLWYALDARSSSLADTGIVAPSPVDYSQIESEEVIAKSADGTMVPLSIIRQRGIAMDGSHTTWLEGYGAYGITIDPAFNPERPRVLRARRRLSLSSTLAAARGVRRGLASWRPEAH